MMLDRSEWLFDADYEDLLAIGSRMMKYEPRFDNRRGFDREDDTLPYELSDFKNVLDIYYEYCG